jgi:transposase
MIPKLIPFAQECLIERPNTLVQEDNAPSHAHHYQREVYDLYKIQCLLWPGNSPDLNMIEPGWYWMKKRTTSRGPPTSRKALIESWERAWKDLPQSKIQAWIERIPRHIEEVIRLEGGNEYLESRTGEDRRSWKGMRLKGCLSHRQDLPDL